jgi:hypothetical protein
MQRETIWEKEEDPRDGKGNKRGQGGGEHDQSTLCTQTTYHKETHYLEGPGD